MNGHHDPIRREVERHPGVGVRFEPRGKHDAVVLSFEGRSRFVIVSKTPTRCPRALKNKIRDVRHEIQRLKEGTAR